MPTPENKAREAIDSALEKAGWKVQNTKATNLRAGRGVVLRSYFLTQSHGFSEDRFQIINDLRHVTETNPTRADRLWHGVLKSAFAEYMLNSELVRCTRVREGSVNVST